jgi:uncharacterized protein
LLTREQGLRILSEVGCPPEVIRHSLAVERKALEIAKRISENGYAVDLKLVELGAILHDVGRSRTHGIEHGIRGAEILRSKGLGKFTGFAEAHIGAGIPANEAKELGLPERDFMPRTLEEKIVTYADKLVFGAESVPFEEAREQLKAQLGAGHPALERFDALHAEIQKLQGED